MSLETIIVALVATNVLVLGAVALATVRFRHHATTTAARRHAGGALDVLGTRRPHDDLNRRWP